MTTGLNPLLALLAGALTILSPCVLPLVPIVLAGAGRTHKWGPVALGLGLVLSFTAAGFTIAVFGQSAGFDGEIVQTVGAAALLLVGLLMVVPGAQLLIARAAVPLADWAGNRQARLERFGLAGQAGIGVLLGLIWSPCVGPTLGAATVLAAEGRDLRDAAVVMAAFGLGIAGMLVLLAFASRAFLARWRGRLSSAGGRGRIIFGFVLILVALLILSGADRLIEGILVELSPDWLTDLTTSA